MCLLFRCSNVSQFWEYGVVPVRLCLVLRTTLDRATVGMQDHVITNGADKFFLRAAAQIMPTSRRIMIKIFPPGT